jgi:RluA family pseudouridine synthase
LDFCPLGEIFRLFRNGKVLLNGKKCKENDRVEAGEIEIIADENELRAKFADKNKSNFKIIYEDQYLIVCDKPAGVATQPGKNIPQGSSLIELAKNYYAAALPVHRIDADTSGLVLIAKDVEFLRVLQKIWDSDLVKKEYLAVCQGVFDKKSGKIELNLQKDGLKMSVAENGELHSVSRYKILSQKQNCALVAVEIETGRMHQIRAQFSHLQHCILGDKRYGNEFRDKEIEKTCGMKISRLMLHSHKISFIIGKKNYSFSAEIPEVFHKFH